MDKKDKPNPINTDTNDRPLEQSSAKAEKERPTRVFLGQTIDGAKVYDRKNSHFHSEGGLTPELLSSALGTIDAKNRNFIKEKVKFDGVVGGKTCVEVGPEDNVVMVYRKGRNGMTPMVKDREMEPCDTITVIMRKTRAPRNQRDYELLTSYIGEGSPREPWDSGIGSEAEKKESEEFWMSHALIYDDDLIDWEKTKAFEFMSESAKEAEQIRQRAFFSGLFINPEEIYSKVQPTLEKPVKHPHVTTAFRPESSQLLLEQIGSDAKIYAVGYGNDGKNEGLLVKVEAEDPEVQAACDALKTPHITLSTSRRGQAKNTAFLEFTPLEKPIDLTGKFGFFSQGEVIRDQEKLAQLKKDIQKNQHSPAEEDD